ncbi:MAG: hypothetical protein HOB92_00075, partial [Candidatus Cloacimonetes bacterium]|nr:hypothetical protein [Candidatus Cloacimonadota bacterium]
SFTQTDKDAIEAKWFGKKSDVEKPTFEKLSLHLSALHIKDQIEDYIRANPKKTLKQLQKDEAFRNIVIQKIGETGKSALVESTDGIITIHMNREMEGIDVHSFKETLPTLWEMISVSLGQYREDSYGSYLWREEEGGPLREKYAYQACVDAVTADGKSFYLTAATYLDEFSGFQFDKKTSFAEESIKQKAEDVAKQVEIYMVSNPNMTLKELQEDSYFRDIAIQSVGETGYTAILNYETLFNLFHIKPEFQGMDLSTLKESLPDIWDILMQANRGYDSGGIYDWIEPDGTTKQKYMYTAIVKIRTADGIGMAVAATAYLDDYERIELTEKKKESLPIIPLIWILGVLIFGVIFLLLLDKLNIIKFEKNAIMFFLSIALLLITGLFIYNAYNISKKLKKTALENYYDTLNATASTKYLNIEQHISHVKSSFKVIRSRKAISNEDLNKIVDFGEDFIEVFRTDSNGIITHSSDLSNIGLSRLADDYFKNAIDKIYIKPLYRPSTVGEIIFTISAPYKEGVLVARMSLKHIYEIISKKEGLGKTGESLLAYRNKNGNAVFFTERRFIAEAEARDVIPKEDVNIPITQALLGNEKEYSNYVDYRNVHVLAVTKHIEGIDAGLVVKIDQKEAFESVSGNIKQIWYSTTIIIFAIIIIGIIFYFLLTNTLRREVKNKTSDLEKASMVLSEKVFLLQNSERKLLSASQLNENIIASSPVGILIYNAAGDCIISNNTAVELIGGTKAQILQQNYHQVDSWKKSGLYDIVLSSIQEKTKKRQEIKVKTTFEKALTLDIQLVPFSIEDDPHLLIMFEDITDRKKAENRIKTALKEKEVLFKEVHHRVKNNMQIIQSLLSLQSNEIRDPEHKKPLIDSNNRIKSMALIHEILYQSDDMTVLDIHTYFNKIVKHLFNIYRDPECNVAFNLDIDTIQMGMDLSIACGLIINELVSNALKYAFVSDSNGDLFISLKRITTNEALMIVKDNGHGLPVDLDFNTNDSLGLKIVKILVEGQLKGSMKVKNEHGASFEIYFPLSK